MTELRAPNSHQGKGMDPTSTDFYMSKSQAPNSHKRKRNEPCLYRSEIFRPESKKQKLDHQPPKFYLPSDPSSNPSSDPSSYYIPPPSFWDTLSKIWLTKDALRELDRRNAQSDLESSYHHQEAQRPITRKFLAELRHRQSTRAVENFFRGPRIPKEIQQFARQGGPNISDLRGFCEPVDPLYLTMKATSYNSRSSVYRVSKRGSRKTSTTTTTTIKSGKSGTYSANFEQKLVDRGYFRHGYRLPNGGMPPKPDNWEEIIDRLAQPRRSLSPFSEENFEEFVQADTEARNEEAVKNNVISKMLTVCGLDDIQKNIRFTNFAPLDGFRKGDLKLSQPDYYAGARPEQLTPIVRKMLSSNIIPSTVTHYPIAPNFFLEAKGPGGTMEVAARQAGYDGVQGIRAMQSLVEYGQGEPVFDNKAYTLSAVYINGMIRIYSHHAAQPDGPGTRPQCYMHMLGVYSMIHRRDAHVEGLAALMNAASWAKEVRDAVIANANAKAAQQGDDEERMEVEPEDGMDDEEEEAKSSSMTPRSDHGTERTFSSFSSQSDK